MAKLNFAGVDYIRYSYADHRAYQELSDILLPERVEVKNAGGKEQSSWLLGYYGVKTDHSFLGRRDDGTLVQASSSLADVLWMSLGLSGAHCTRIDLQLTVPGSPSPDAQIKRAYEEIQACPAPRGRPAEPQLITRPSGARMVTLGSRQSEYYGRIYDKFKESGEEAYRGFVRYEVEIKAKSAHQCYEWLRAKPYARQVSAGLVYEYWERKGVTVDFKIGEPIAGPPKVERHKTNATRVAWLATQVSPTLARLVEDGYAEEAARALLTAFDIISGEGEKVGRLSKMLTEVFQGEGES